MRVDTGSASPRRISSNVGLCVRVLSGTNGFGLTPTLAARVLVRIERSVFRLPDSDDVYAEWRRLVSAYGVSGKKAHDTRIVAAMTIHGITNILTFDTEGFSRFPSINVIDPLRR